MGNTWMVVRQAASDAYITYYDGQAVVLDFDGDSDPDICVIGVSPTHPYSVSSTRFDTYVREGQNSNIVARSTYTLECDTTNNTVKVAVPQTLPKNVRQQKR